LDAGIVDHNMTDDKNAHMRILYQEKNNNTTTNNSISFEDIEKHINNIKKDKYLLIGCCHITLNPYDININEDKKINIKGDIYCIIIIIIRT